ncbi:DNA-binding protein HU |uniref:DNA-binding protein HU \
MTKSDFIELVQKNGGFENKATAEKAIKAFTESITETLVAKDSITLIGFGTFSTIEVAEKSGKIPGKDATYTKVAHTAPKFKMGKTIKDAVAGN